MAFWCLTALIRPRLFAAIAILLILAVALYIALSGDFAFTPSTGPRGEILSCYCLGEFSVNKFLEGDWRVAIVEVESFPADLIGDAKDKTEILLGYVNAGYAEEWRNYWNSVVEEGLIIEPSGYQGEWLVRYWEPVWHDILLSQVLWILSIGYDGVYLDNIDAYEYVYHYAEAEGVDPRDSIIDLVCLIKQEIARVDPEALIAINIGGGYELLYDEDFTKCIDLVLREEVWKRWTENGVQPQDPRETDDIIKALEYVAAEGIIVVVVDPVSSEEEAVKFCRWASEEGFMAIPQPAWLADYQEPPPWSCR